MLVEKTDKYKVGVSSITAMVGKEKKLKFDNGEPIEVTNETYETLMKLGWGKEKEVKNGK